LFLLFFAASLAAAQPSPLLDAMSQELTRNFLALKDKADPPPYFLSYEVTETEGHSLSASLGALESDSNGINRTLDTSVRVGSPKLDNYHRVRGAGGAQSGRFTSGMTIPFEDIVNSVKRLLWLDTDRAYQLAAERLIRIKTDTQVRVAEADDSDDFSSEPPVVSVAPPPRLKFDEEAWRDRGGQAREEDQQTPRLDRRGFPARLRRRRARRGRREQPRLMPAEALDRQQRSPTSLSALNISMPSEIA